MGKKIKVFNKTKHKVGVTMMSGAGRTIAPNTFIIADEDEVANWAASTRLFSAKHLTIDDEEVMTNCGLSKEDVAYETDDEIRKILEKSNLAALRKYLESVTEIHVANRIKEVAKECDLKSSKNDLIDSVFEKFFN